MDKDIIFFSHSSHDEKALRKLKDLLTEKTAGTVEIFLSSDGQSIPLGRNWVSRLEEAMKQSRIMLVFLSPMSQHSQWIYFEAGYAYRRDIQVVPIGILGVDLEQIGPPLGLLQGFNIKSEDGLNNIIALINDEFGHSHKESFTKEEYHEIFVRDQMFGEGALGEYASMVDEIVIELPYSVDSALDRIIKVFDDANIQYQFSGKGQWLHAPGLSLYLPSHTKLVSARVDPSLTALTFGTLDNVFKDLYEQQPDSYPVTVVFMPWVNYQAKKHKLTARLYDTDIALGEEGNLVFGEIAFNIEQPKAITISTGRVLSTPATPKVRLKIEYHGKMLSDMPLSDLLRILFERGVLYLD